MIASAQSPRLADVHAVVHWHIYGENNKTYKSQMADKAPVAEFPILLVQTSDGEVVAKVSGEAVPDSPAKMGYLIRRLWRARPCVVPYVRQRLLQRRILPMRRPYYILPWRKPPSPSPGPSPEPDLVPVVPANIEVQVGSLIPDTTPVSDGTPWGLAVLAFVGSGLATLVFKFSRAIQ